MMTNALNNFVQGGQVRHPDDCLSASLYRYYDLDRGCEL